MSKHFKRSKHRRKKNFVKKMKKDSGYLVNLVITEDEDFHPYDFNITDEIADAVNFYRKLCNTDPMRAAIELPEVIEQFPEVPQLKNHLYVAYKYLNRIEEAYAINDLALEDHPEYIYAVLNKAIQYFEKNEFEEVEEVLKAPPFIINQSFPFREIFHANEVANYYGFLIRLFLKKEDVKGATSFYQLLANLVPDHLDLPNLEEVIQLTETKILLEGTFKDIQRDPRRKSND